MPLALAIGAASIWPRSNLTYAHVLRGWPVMSDGVKSYYHHGLTRWLVVEQRELVDAKGFAAGTGFAIERKYYVEGVGLLAYAAMVIAAIAACRWAHRHLVMRPLSGVCDHCGYNLTGVASPVCPECGEG